MLMPAVGSVHALINNATCFSCRARPVFGKTVVRFGLTLLSALSVWMELDLMSLAALINLNWLSNERISLNAVSLEVASAVVAPGALFKIRTLASEVPESATESCRASTPVKNRLTFAIETLLGKCGNTGKAEAAKQYQGFHTLFRGPGVCADKDHVLT